MVDRNVYPEIDTPAVIIDLDILERNIENMAEMCKSKNVALRPHIKTHKSPWIAHKQIKHGAKGITVAKLEEAEVMAQAGITDILIAYPLIGEHKMRKLERLLASGLEITLSLDSVEVAKCVAAAAKRVGRKGKIYIDVDTGLGRVGHPSGLPTLQLAQQIDLVPNIEIVGVMTHEGHVMWGKNLKGIAELSVKAAQDLVETARLLREAGIPAREVSVGSSNAVSFNYDVEGVTEVRPGTYVFNHASSIYSGLTEEGECAATILTTVVSRPSPGKAIIDAGSKTFSSDLSVEGPGFGLVRGGGPLRMTVKSLSEEHGIVEFDPEQGDLKIGDRLEVFPNHVCPTINLSDIIYGVRKGRMEMEIPVLARGKRR